MGGVIFFVENDSNDLMLFLVLRDSFKDLNLQYNYHGNS